MNPMYPLYGILGGLGLVFVIALLRSIRVVPTQSALVVERLGKYRGTLDAGFHVLLPFVDRVRYRHTLKEQAIDVPAQECFTLDNVRVEVDGVLYLKVVDPKKASYGIRDYRYGTIQLAQTTMRSVVGQLELDRTFEERDRINAGVVRSVDDASDPWGVKVTRYEIQNIKVPDTIMEAMEVQMKAEREKRAEIAKSLGEMESRINLSTAVMEEAINKSEGEKERMINEAQGEAEEILAVAKATAEGIRQVAAVVSTSGGEEAATLRVTEAWIDAIGSLAKKDAQVVIPVDLTDMKAISAGARALIKDRS